MKCRCWTHDFMVSIGYLQESAMAHASTPGLSSNTKSLLISQLWRNPHYPRNRKTIFICNFKWPICIVQTPNVLAPSKSVRKLAKYEKCNSKIDKLLDIVWNNENYIRLKQCTRNICLLLVRVTLKLTPNLSRTKLWCSSLVIIQTLSFYRKCLR